MGRPRITDTFTPFFEWMRTTRRCSPGVAKAYTSFMRRIFREIDENFMDQEVVNAFFARAYESDDSYAKIRSAWSMYVEYMLVEHEQVVPQPQSVAMMHAKERVRPASDNRVPPLPSPVRAALRVLDANQITVHQVFHLRWLHVSLGDMNSNVITHVNTPNKNTQWLIPSHAIRALWNYANVGTNLSLPLVPKEPGSDIPYPYTALRREIGIFTQDELDQLMKNQTNGSALGSVLVRNTPKSQEPEKSPALTTHDVLDLLKAPVKKKPVPVDDLEPDEDTSFGDEDDEPEGLSSLLAYNPKSKD